MKDEKLKKMYEMITERISPEAIGHLDCLHILQNVLHGAIDRLGAQVLEMGEKTGYEEEKEFWEGIKFLITVLNQQTKTLDELRILLNTKLAKSTIALMARQEEELLIEELRESGLIVLESDSDTIH